VAGAQPSRSRLMPTSAVARDAGCVLSGETTLIRVAKAESQSSVNTHGANQIIRSIRDILCDKLHSRDML
jgi:hypothetical protein